VVALAMLLVPAAWLTVPWVMAAQALSGIAKDLNKMSAKSAIKVLVPDATAGQRCTAGWRCSPAPRTRSRGPASSSAGCCWRGGLHRRRCCHGGVLAVVWLASLVLLHGDLGRAKAKPQFREVFSKSAPVNVPVGGAAVPVRRPRRLVRGGAAGVPGHPARLEPLAVGGFLAGGSSATASYLIVAYARADGVSLDVGFYYMSNAAGRLIGTVLSGWVFQAYGIAACLWVSAGMLAVATLVSLGLPRRVRASAPPT
jgi:hypothetical protein